MRSTADNPFVFNCEDGEMITVNVWAHGTESRVIYSLNDRTARFEDSLYFQVDARVLDPTILQFDLEFSQSEGGMYRIIITGSNGEFSDRTVQQSEGQKSQQLAYLFEVQEPVRFLSSRSRIKRRTTSSRGGGGAIKGGSPPRRRKRTAPPPRYVNVSFTETTNLRLIPRTSSLEANKPYDLRINIGQLSPESAVRNPKPFPTKLLPATTKGHWVEAVVASDDFKFERHRHMFFLPRRGESWVCACSPHRPHECNKKSRSQYLYIRMQSPKPTPDARLRIGIYCAKNLIQSQLLEALVEETEHEGEGYESTIDYTLTASLNNLESLAPRTLNILTNENPDGTHRVVFNGALDDAMTFSLTEGQVTNAIGAARQKLLDVHMKKYGGHLGSTPQFQNLYDINNAKSTNDFIDDLKQLAPLGRDLWDVLLTDQPESRRKLYEELLLQPSTIQVSRIRRSNFVFPWGTVYDIPLESDAAQHQVCRLLKEWAQASSLISTSRPDCPYKDTHVKNIICPFGFWGFRHTIEQPPSMPSSRDLPLIIKVANRPVELVVALSLDLDEVLTKAHLDTLQAQLAAEMNVRRRSSRRAIATNLADPKIELIYFYCHGERQTVPGSNAPTPFLEIGDKEKLTTGDIISWSDSDWTRQHWRETSPLVFINGCHTAELTPQVLVNFVDAFAGVYASGVIGTEIMLHQRVANEVGQKFFDYFKSRKSVGEALSYVRLSLLLKGNLLGLAYTPYCSAELHLS